METDNTSGREFAKFYVGQRVEYFAGSSFHTERYVGQQGTITGIDTRNFSILWDTDDVIINRNWKPLIKNIRPILTDVGDLEDDY